MRLARLVMVPVLVGAALVACGGGGGDASSVPPITAANAGTTTTSSISSARTGLSYTLDIWLPPGYAGDARTYSVVYAMDCEYRFVTLVSVLQQAAAKGLAPMILVNVCAGTPARRFVDFTMPGATAYFGFLTLELIPLIDATYRTNPKSRVLSGHSLSGEFAMLALYMEDPANRYFTSIVSADCSCWIDANGNFATQLAVPVAMEQAMFAASNGSLPINLVMAADTISGGERNVMPLYELIVSRRYRDLRSIQPAFSLGHVPMDGPAFSDAIDFIAAGS
ncbi:MAG: alpha/beta hydrolase-fold protein [Pseudomonadota bacterium]|nr:alpha/beta hydrolase-fold protein [Pseudomonadota bacterium]